MCAYMLRQRAAHHRRQAGCSGPGMRWHMQAITDGKPLILEGVHLDPGLFLQKLTQVGLVMLPASEWEDQHAMCVYVCVCTCTCTHASTLVYAGRFRGCYPQMSGSLSARTTCTCTHALESLLVLPASSCWRLGAQIPRATCKGQHQCSRA